MPYTQMATQASSGDGIKNTKHHPVSLVKQFFTCCQTQQSFQRWNSASCQAYGLVKTQHPMRTSLEFPTRLFEHEQPEGFQHQKSTTSNWWTWSTDHQHSHTPLVDHAFQNHHWSTSQWGDQQLQKQAHKLLEQTQHNSHNFKHSSQQHRQVYQHDVPLQTHQWQQHQQAVTPDHHFHHQTNSFRRSGRRQSAKATPNSRSSNRSSKAWHSTRATNKQTKNHKGDDSNKERGRNNSIHLWRHHRRTNREDPFGTNGQQHRRIRQTEDLWRNEEWDRFHKETTGIHGSRHQHSDPRTKEEQRTVKMGSQRQRQQRSCKNC